MCIEITTDETKLKQEKNKRSRSHHFRNTYLNRIWIPSLFRLDTKYSEKAAKFTVRSVRSGNIWGERRMAVAATTVKEWCVLRGLNARNQNNRKIYAIVSSFVRGECIHGADLTDPVGQVRSKGRRTIDRGQHSLSLYSYY